MEISTLSVKSLVESPYCNLCDQEIVRLAQESDQYASEYLLYKYRVMVRAKVRSYYLMGAEREDLLQVGMIGLWQAIIDFQHDKDVSFLAFARICVERHIITAIKAASRRKQHPLNFSMSLEQPIANSDSDWNLVDIIACEESSNPEDMVLESEERMLLHTMLRRLLSDFEWNVLTRYHIGKSYREIAIELQCKPKAVDNALVRIKKKISLAPHNWPGITDIL